MPIFIQLFVFISCGLLLSSILFGQVWLTFIALMIAVYAKKVWEKSKTA